MEQELFEGLKKGRRRALETVCQENLRRTWYLCWKVAPEGAVAAPLMLRAWKEALSQVKGMKSPPQESFQGMLSRQVAALSQKVEPEERFALVAAPRLGKAVAPVGALADRLASPAREAYWLVTYGELSLQELSQAWEKPVEELERVLSQGEERLAQRRAKWPISQRAAYVRLSTQLRDAGGNGFGEVSVPESLREALWKEAGLPLKPVKKRPKKPWTKKRLAALGLAVGAGALLLAGGVLALVLGLT